MKSIADDRVHTMDDKDFKSMVKSISRSLSITFYLLPKQQQKPILIAYLLAKLGDSIVDAYGETAIKRSKAFIALQNSFQNAINGGGSVEISDLTLLKFESEAELHLAKKLKSILAYYIELSDTQRGHVEKVVKCILLKQKEELDSLNETGVYRLTSMEELGSYVYQMSGVVGEFWTDISLEGENYSKLERATLCKLGRDYGNALHYLNILRDVKQDFDNQRFYVPVDNELSEAAIYENGQKLIHKIELGLQSGLKYAKSLNNYKLRIGISMPARIGLLYLSKMRHLTWEEFKNKKIITRNEVYKLLVSSLFKSR